MVIRTKCAKRILLEEQLIAGEVPQTTKCETCYGFRTDCEDRIELRDLINNYEAMRGYQKPNSS